MNCNNSYLGEYQCSQELYTPPWVVEQGYGRLISFDKCLESEILSLWEKGIVTTNSCCGRHADSRLRVATICVETIYILDMIELSYMPVNQYGCFVAKTEFGKK